ncbi:hypothetical protein [Glaciecola sp. 33A]|uniref:hypothetical protein n=1 Tax=Glaciecola sp. 33A TaxID=2057807 RepID=UPI001E39EBE1|nr:hypothetical protein [Glaciecola sp. 33A]
MVSTLLHKVKGVLTRSLSKMIVITLLVCAQHHLFAQEKAQNPASVEAQRLTQQQEPLALPVVSAGNTSSNADILRLEETIRGNKEQPKVLSIVPWQLPLYQRIDRNKQRWAPIKTELKSLERNSFLREIKLLEGIQNGQSSIAVDAQNN